MGNGVPVGWQLVASGWWLVGWQVLGRGLASLLVQYPNAKA
jgi:hypothetical protein